MEAVLDRKRQRQIIEYEGPVECRVVKNKGAGEDSRN
jgi:hypothetical protein